MKARKKWWIAIGIILVLFISSLSLSLPGEWDVSKIQLTECNVSGAFRVIGDEAAWGKWWPAGGINGYSYRVTGKIYPETGVLLQRGGEKFPGILTVLSVGTGDSISLLWKCHFAAGLNPVSRYLEYRKGMEVKNVLTLALDSLGSFLQKNVNVYGLDVQRIMSHDSTLVVTQVSTLSYPSTEDLYKAIRTIRKYISNQGAGETDPPMLHVSRNKDGQYESMIAVPVDRELKGEGRLSPVRFVPWKVLTGEVHGGAWTAERAMEQLQLYVTDHQKTAIALPFQSLVTERDKEPDTSRWVTRVIQSVP
ncbi:MAG TPA: hypothetical protein VGM31_13480 [Puia sp.]|jgi:hypothetical protein